jgi:uncharacterized protein (DUF983 family)
MTTLCEMKAKYEYYASEITQSPLQNCPECHGTGEMYHPYFKNTFVCMCMTIHCSFSSDEDRMNTMRTSMAIRDNVFLVTGGS